MGTGDSKPLGTPAKPLRHWQLARVLDPRSPSAGIPRTPIEVVGLPRNSPAASEAQESAMQDAVPVTDPRSPTHGITRTPVKPTDTETVTSLAVQLSETFLGKDVDTPLTEPRLDEKAGAEDDVQREVPDSKQEEEEVAEMMQAPLKPWRSEEKVQRSNWSPAALASNSGRPAKQKSRITGGKGLQPSAVNGRSPLQTLWDDSPNTVCHRQVKSLLLVEDRRNEARDQPMLHSTKVRDRHFDKENTARYPPVVH